jgi:hypothetical protein
MYRFVLRVKRNGSYRVYDNKANRYLSSSILKKADAERRLKELSRWTLEQERGGKLLAYIWSSKKHNKYGYIQHVNQAKATWTAVKHLREHTEDNSIKLLDVKIRRSAHHDDNFALLRNNGIWFGSLPTVDGRSFSAPTPAELVAPDFTSSV